MPRKLFLAAESDLSFDDIDMRLREALADQFGRAAYGDPLFCLYETFPDYLIARGPNDALFRIPYTLSGDNLTFGDAQEVETAYVPVAAECEFLAREADAADDGAFPIVIIKPGWAGGALNGQSVPHYYTPEFCKLVAEAAHGVPFGRRHPDQKSSDPTGANDPDRIAGFVSGGALANDQSARGTVTLFAAEADLRSKLGEAVKMQKQTGKSAFGVSMLASVGGHAGKVEGKDAFVIDQLGKLYSVDLCARAGAGGQFLAAASLAGNDIAAAQLAAVKPNTSAIAPHSAPSGNQGSSRSGAQTGVRMNKHLKALLDALKAKNPTKAADFYSRAVLATEAEQENMQAEVITAIAEPVPATATTTTVAAESATQLAELHRAQSRNRIEAKLLESKLSEPAKKLVRGHLETRLASEAEMKDDAIDAEITSTRDAFAAFESVGRVRSGGVVLESREKMQLAMEAMLGVKEAKSKGVAPFRGLRDAYVQITGDTYLDKLSRGGGFSGTHVLASEAVSTADFPNLLLNAQHKLLLQEWAELALDGLEALYSKADLSDYKQQDRVRDGFFQELAIVGEGAAYQEMTKPTDERVSYAPQKRGGILTISEETIRNDDLGAIARFPGKMARAGRQTLRSFIVNFFSANPNYAADGLAWFHASHSNLLAVPFSQDALITAQTQLRRQQEKDSAEYLGLPLRWIAVPPELEAAAVQLNQTNTAGSNAFFQRFGVNNERIFVVEKFTDTNDWYYGTDSNLAPFLELGFLDGKDQPEIFLANMPTVGTQFTNDELQYKVKLVFGGAITDFRGIGKSVNA